MNRKTIIRLTVVGSLLLATLTGAGIALVTNASAATGAGNTTTTPTDTPTTTENSTQTATTTTTTPTSSASSTTTTPTPTTSSDSDVDVNVNVGGQSKNKTTKNQTIPAYHYRVSKSLEIVGIDWDRGPTGHTVVIKFKSDRPQIVSLVDVNSIETKGAGNVNYREVTLSSGTTVVRMQVEDKRGDKTLTIGTADSLDYISNPDQPFLTGDVSVTDLYIAAAGGALGSILIGGLYVLVRSYRLKKGWQNVLNNFSP